MPGPTDLIVWFLGTAFELLFVVCALARKSFLRYFFLNLYLLLSTTVSIGRFFIFWSYGQRSDQYMYFYYYSDALLTVALFVALISLYSHVLGELRVGDYVKWGAVLKLRETRTRLVQIILSLGLYFSGYAASYALMNFSGKFSILRYMCPA